MSDSVAAPGKAPDKDVATPATRRGWRTWGVNRNAIRRLPLPLRRRCPPRRKPGIGWSDHWAFWQAGYPAIMVTATAPFRNPNYHEATDTADTLDYQRMARVVDGLETVIRMLADNPG